MVKEWYKSEELIGTKGFPETKSGICRRYGDKLRRKAGGIGGGYEYHLSNFSVEQQVAILAKYTESEPPGTEGDTLLWQSYDKKPERTKKKGKRRLAAVLLYFILLETKPAMECYREVAKVEEVSANSLRAWVRKVKDAPRPDWLPILTGDHHRAGRHPKEIPAELWEPYKADYLRIEAPAHTSVYERVEDIAKAKGLKCPPETVFRRKMKAEVPDSIIVFSREGETGLHRLYPSQQRTREAYKPMDIINGDGHVFNVFVEWPDGRVCRPCVLAWQCVYSGKWLGWRVDQNENSDLVRMSLHDVFKRWGYPNATVLTDNGSAFVNRCLRGGDSKRFKLGRAIQEDEPIGLLTQFVGDVYCAEPGRGQSKPIERGFGDFTELARHPAFAGFYAGRNLADKPEDQDGKKGVPLATFLAVLDDGIKKINARTGRRGGVCHGRSFDQVFDEGYVPGRMPSEEELRLWQRRVETKKTDKKNGAIAFLENIYWHKDLIPYRDQRLMIRFDPDDLTKALLVYDRDGRFIVAAPKQNKAGFREVEAAKPHNRGRNKLKKGVRQARKQQVTMTAQEVAAQIPINADPEAQTRVHPRYQAGNTIPADLPEETETVTRDWEAMSRGLDRLEQEREAI